MQNSIRQTTSEDESTLKPVPDSQTGELEFSCSGGPCSDRDCSADKTGVESGESCNRLHVDKIREGMGMAGGTWV